MNRLRLHRILLWAALLLFAAWFLTPLYVMVVTSLKDMQQVREGNLLSLPSSPTLASWAKAWSSACTGIDCGGLKPFFMNSLLMVVPAVAFRDAALIVQNGAAAVPVPVLVHVELFRST